MAAILAPQTESATLKQVIHLTSPFPEAILPLIWQWLNEWAEATLDDYSPQTLQQLVAKNEADQRNGSRCYAVEQGGRFVGAVWFENAGDGVFLGHLAFDRTALSSREKLNAARAALDRLWTEGGRKAQWAFFSTNRCFRVFLKRLGAKQEGLVRQQTRRHGELRDLILMASFKE